MKKWPDEKNQLDKIEQRIIDLAHQQTLLLSLDNKEIFKLLEKAEAENKTLTEQNKLMREALEKALQKLSGGHIDYYETTTLELQNLHEQAGYAFNIIEDALEATKEKV